MVTIHLFPFPVVKGLFSSRCVSNVYHMNVSDANLAEQARLFIITMKPDRFKRMKHLFEKNSKNNLS